MQPSGGTYPGERRNRTVIIAVASACALVIAAAVTTYLLVFREPDSPNAAPQTPSNVDERVRAMTGHDETVSFVHWSPDGTRLASVGGFDHTVRVWDPATGQTLLTLPGDGASWSADSSRLVTFGLDGTVSVWDAASGAETLTLSIDDLVWDARLSPDNSRLVTVQGVIVDATTALWDAGTGELIENLGPGTTSGWHPGGDPLVLVEDYDGALLWDAASGDELRTFVDVVSSAAFSPDGALIAGVTGDGDTVTIWDTATGAERRTMTGDIGWINDLAWSPDGSQVAVCDEDSAVLVWDVASGETVLYQQFEDGALGVTLDWSPDGTRLAIVPSMAAEAQIVEVATGTTVQTLTATGRDYFLSIDWSPDGTLVATGHHDGAVRIWSVN